MFRNVKINEVFYEFTQIRYLLICAGISLITADSTEGEKVRPKWEDGSYAYTMKKFGVVNRYDLSKEFPAITLRKTAIKTCYG